jgi:membrane protein YqaA with SNARE-associated domain
MITGLASNSADIPDTSPSITYTSNLVLKTIGHMLARYTAWILGMMKLLGIWGVFVIAFADSALLGMPVDFIVATYVYQDRKRMLLYILMAALGSAIGSIPLYIIGYLGGEKVLRKRIPEERFLKIHRSFERHEFWALMFPGMLPPPMPFKIFVLAAAVFEMKFRDFLIAIFAGRFVRFLALSILVLWFGPQIIGLFGGVFKRHWISVLIAIGASICVWLVLRQRRKAEETEG